MIATPRSARRKMLYLHEQEVSEGGGGCLDLLRREQKRWGGDSLLVLREASANQKGWGLPLAHGPPTEVPPLQGLFARELFVLLDRRLLPDGGVGPAAQKRGSEHYCRDDLVVKEHLERVESGPCIAEEG
jgi:hypothetical protein